ncbi:hypothetical protein BsWGS_23007 [Bradybaena similaris]
MGAENSILEGCEWGSQIDCPPKFPWQMSPVTKPDGTSGTVLTSKSSDKKNEELLQQFASTLRGLRHPNIIRFIGCGHSSDGFWLVTESVQPLFTFVSDMSSHELCAGLYDVLQGLEFLHSKLGVCHNNICLPSVFVSSDGSWKLGGLEFACKFHEATQEYLDRIRAFRLEDSLSPEEKASSVRADRSLGHARDVFAFGTLVDAMLDLVREKDTCAQMLEQQLSACLSPDPSSRPGASVLLSLPVFRSELIEVITFLRHITVKTDAEKKEFFRNLMSQLCRLPEMAVARRLVVPLLARFVLLDEWAVVHVLPHLLTPKGSHSKKASHCVQGLLPEHLFRQYIINHIYNIFHVYDSHIRLVLLEHFSQYVTMFTQQQLEDDIFLQVLLGVRDTDDRLVAASLRALADLVPVLGGDVVVGGVRKPFFFHGMPKISALNLSKMNVPQNMMAILADHKPLLKNLAATSNNSSNDDNGLTSKEKLARDRERRKEEAKLKREARKHLMKEKLAEKKQGNSWQGDSDDQVSGLTIEQVGRLEDEDDTLLTKPENDDAALHKSVIGENDRDQENTAPDWSDWEDADQKISDEIESELEAMSGTISTEPKLQTSPSPYRSHTPPSPPPVKVMWPDVPEAERSIDKSTGDTRGGSLSLKAKNIKRNGQINEGNHTDKQLVISDTWENGAQDSQPVNHPASNSELRNNPTSTSSSKASDSLKLSGASVGKQPKKAIHRQTDDLGAGFDIKSINIVKAATPPELDFFADMAPSIIEQKPAPLTALLDSKGDDSTWDKSSVLSSPLSSGKIEDGQVKVNSELFAASAVVDEDVTGWGEDDIDWGEEVPS